jgi:hypothetical protein
MLHPPGTEAFPASTPHSVEPYARTRWSSGLTRWWNAIFRRNAYARGPDTVRSGRSGHHFFQHLIEDEAASDAARPDEAGK